MRLGGVLLFIVAFCGSLSLKVYGSCVELNNCSGHGICSLNSKCDCFEGWGAPDDITTYRAPDCSARVCPSGISWGDLSSHSVEKECSDRGQCNRRTGKCVCDKGFEGRACQRKPCPNNCSGHGWCLSMERLATTADGLPLSPPTTYEVNNATLAWDSRKIMACLCESSWPVGLGAGQTQEPEWFGPDCSLRHCPSADNPRTVLNETDCSNFNITGINGTIGEAGNLCQVDCANQGICDHKTGTCACFAGQYGTDCSSQIEMPVNSYNYEEGVYSYVSEDSSSSGGAGGSRIQEDIISGGSIRNRIDQEIGKFEL